MLDYLNRNKEWIFSGVGISVVTAIFFGVRWAVRWRGQGLRPTRPFPKTIIRDIMKRPPLQQPEASQHYAGLRVRWKVSLYSARLRSDGSAHLMLLDRGGHYPWVYADISVLDYPEVKTLPQRTKLWISGIIHNCDGNTITLSDATITKA